MATGEQIKALLESHADGDNQRFYSTALRMAAKEARKGHHRLANEIKLLAEKTQRNNLKPVAGNGASVFRHSLKGDLKGLLELTSPHVRRGELILSSDIKSRLDEFLLEQKQKDKLKGYGLSPRRKLLFTGSPGTGKTMSAAVLANELNLPLYTIVLDNLITRFMGETASKLRLVFDHIAQTRAIYLFDEFDAIGAQRGTQNDVGEIRRVLNSFLIFVEQDISESVIIAATNHPELLDTALHRRFDDIIQFEKPKVEQILELIRSRLAAFNIKGLKLGNVAKSAEGLSAAEVTRACEEAAKDSVLHSNGKISAKLISKHIKRRQQIRG